MPSKGKGGGKGGNNTKTSKSISSSKSQRIEKDPLQAIVFADSFTSSFRPITLHRPKVMLPLLGTPMIDYVMEMLTTCEVDEIFIICVTKKEMIEEYIVKSKWIGPSVKYVNLPEATCPRDALKEMEQLGTIRSNPFIIISGDTITNIDLTSRLEEHKANVKKYGNIAMSCIFTPVGYNSGIRQRTDDLVVGLDTYTKQIIHYEDSRNNPHISIPLSMVRTEGHQNISLFNDLANSGIYICSPEVLVSFYDNYDFLNFSDFIINSLMNIELGVLVFGQVLTNTDLAYASQILDPTIYSNVSQDLMHRWLYPIVLERNHHQANSISKQQYSYSGRNYIYKSSDGTSIVASTSILGQGVVMSSDTNVGEHSYISQSWLGSSTKIGNHCRLTNCYIWGEVIIGDHVTIQDTIICNDVTIKDGCVIGKGCIISYGVSLAKNSILPDYTALYVPDYLSDDEVPTEKKLPFDVNNPLDMDMKARFEEINRMVEVGCVYDYGTQENVERYENLFNLNDLESSFGSEKHGQGINKSNCNNKSSNTRRMIEEITQSMTMGNIYLDNIKRFRWNCAHGIGEYVDGIAMVTDTPKNPFFKQSSTFSSSVSTPSHPHHHHRKGSSINSMSSFGTALTDVSETDHINSTLSTSFAYGKIYDSAKDEDDSSSAILAVESNGNFDDFREENENGNEGETDNTLVIEPMEKEQSGDVEFTQELVETLIEGYDERSPFADVLMEINSTRFAENKIPTNQFDPIIISLLMKAGDVDLEYKRLIKMETKELRKSYETLWVEATENSDQLSPPMRAEEKQMRAKAFRSAFDTLLKPPKEDDDEDVDLYWQNAINAYMTDKKSDSYMLICRFVLEATKSIKQRPLFVTSSNNKSSSPSFPLKKDIFESVVPLSLVLYRYYEILYEVFDYIIFRLWKTDLIDSEAILLWASDLAEDVEDGHITADSDLYPGYLLSQTENMKRIVTHIQKQEEEKASQEDSDTDSDTESDSDSESDSKSNSKSASDSNSDSDSSASDGDDNSDSDSDGDSD